MIKKNSEILFSTVQICCYLISFCRLNAMRYVNMHEQTVVFSLAVLLAYNFEFMFALHGARVPVLRFLGCCAVWSGRPDYTAQQPQILHSASIIYSRGTPICIY